MTKFFTFNVDGHGWIAVQAENKNRAWRKVEARYPKRHITFVHDGLADEHLNFVAREGVDRCNCGAKYWERDRCVDCGTHVTKIVVGA